MKKDKDMFTIGEAAEAIGITRRIILNYESRGLIKPDIKEGASGNRYYTIDTLTMIRTVRIFQRLGLSLDEIHGYFSGSTDLIKLIIRLETMRDELNLNIEKLSSVRERLIRYAEDNGIELTGKCRHIYIEGPPQHEDENQFITQVTMLIKK